MTYLVPHTLLVPAWVGGTKYVTYFWRICNYATNILYCKKRNNNKRKCRLLQTALSAFSFKLLCVTKQLFLPSIWRGETCFVYTNPRFFHARVYHTRGTFYWFPSFSTITTAASSFPQGKKGKKSFSPLLVSISSSFVSHFVLIFLSCRQFPLISFLFFHFARGGNLSGWSEKTNYPT